MLRFDPTLIMSIFYNSFTLVVTIVIVIKALSHLYWGQLHKFYYFISIYFRLNSQIYWIKRKWNDLRCLKKKKKRIMLRLMSIISPPDLRPALSKSAHEYFSIQLISLRMNIKHSMDCLEPDQCKFIDLLFSCLDRGIYFQWKVILSTLDRFNGHVWIT